MSVALNDSRAAARSAAAARGGGGGGGNGGSSTQHMARRASTSSSLSHGAEDEGDLDDLFRTRRGRDRVREDEETADGGGPSSPQSPFTLTHLLRRVRHDVQRHECQLAALAAEKHEHCEQLATVYAELEKVLRKIQLVSPARRDELAAASSPSPPLTTPATLADVNGHAETHEHADASASAVQQRIQEVLQRHQDRVYDVLADYRAQIDTNARETDRRLRAMEDAIAAIQAEVCELRRTTSSSSEATRVLKTELLERIEVLDKWQQEQTAQHAATMTESNTRGAKLSKALSSLKDELARVSSATAAAHDEQARRSLTLEERMRSMMAEQERIARSVGDHSASLVQLQARDPLEASFQELKDWLGDLEKRMVSRGELLQWSETMQHEMHALRRFTTTLPPRTSESPGTSLTGVEV